MAYDHCEGKQHIGAPQYACYLVKLAQVLLTMLSITPAIAQTLEPEFDALARRWQISHVGMPNQTFDAQQQQDIMRIQKEALGYWQALLPEKNRQSLWADVSLVDEDKSRLGENLRTSFRRILCLARAYHLPGELYQRADIREAITTSLDFLIANYYYPGAQEDGNWWPWEIGIPKLLNDIMSLSYSYLSPQQMEAYSAASRYFAPLATHNGMSPGAKVSTNPAQRLATGGNRTDMVQVVLVRGILSQNETEIRSALEALPAVMATVISGDGFYRDYSFIQHDDIPYTGTYGNVLLEGVGRVTGLIAGSKWAIDSTHMTRINDLLQKAFLPLIYRGQMMDMVNGRAISRAEFQNHAEGHAVLASMLRFLPALPEAERQTIASNIKYELLADTERHFLAHQTDPALYSQAKQLLADSQITATRADDGIYFYPAMDRLVQRTPDYAIGLAWHSYRTGNFECMNDENRRGWMTGDGATYLYDADLMQYTDYWPVINPYRIAGTTTYLDSQLSDCVNQNRTGSRVGQYRNINIRWAGAATLNNIAVAGMDFFNFDDSLRAKKSWFLLPGKMVAIGSGINGLPEKNIGTVADNRKLLSDGRNTLYLDGKKTEITASPLTRKLTSLHIAGNRPGADVGFWFPQNPKVLIEQSTIDTDWAVIGKRQSPVSGQTLSTTLMHDTEQDQYQYVVLPGVTMQQLEDYRRTPDIKIEQADNQAHSIYHLPTRQLLLAVWGTGKVHIRGITTENALALVQQMATEEMVLTISDPTQQQSGVKITLDEKWKIKNDPQQRVTLPDGHELTLSTEERDGIPYTFTLLKE